LGGVAQAAKSHMIPPVLLAEDDENDVLLIKRAFEKSRLVNSLQVACDGEVAVAYLSGDGIYSDRVRFPVPVAMLLDLKLPRKSGLEVLAWVKQQPGLKRMPIIVLTSSREARDVQQAYDLGVNSYLVKPFTPREFTEMLNTFNVYWLVLNEHPEIQRR
jgi:CheY-like chemotaxis protein